MTQPAPSLASVGTTSAGGGNSGAFGMNTTAAGGAPVLNQTAFQYGGSPTGASSLAQSLQNWGGQQMGAAAPSNANPYGAQGQAQYQQAYGGLAANAGAYAPLASFYQGEAQGTSPSLAQAQLNAANQQATNQQYALANSAKGGLGAAAAQSQAMGTAAQLGQQNAQNAVAANIQQQQQGAAGLSSALSGQQSAYGNLGQLGQSQQGIYQGAANTQAALAAQQAALNSQNYLGAQGLANTVQGTQLQAGIAGQQLASQNELTAQQQANQSAQFNAGQNANNVSGIGSAIGDIGKDITSFFDADLIEPKPGGAHWTIREEPSFLLAKNQLTGELRKIATQPLTEQERHEAVNRPHAAGPLGADDPRRMRMDGQTGAYTGPQQFSDMQLGGSGLSAFSLGGIGSAGLTGLPMPGQPNSKSGLGGFAAGVQAAAPSGGKSPFGGGGGSSDPDMAWSGQDGQAVDPSAAGMMAFDIDLGGGKTMSNADFMRTSASDLATAMESARDPRIHAVQRAEARYPTIDPSAPGAQPARDPAVVGRRIAPDLDLGGTRRRIYHDAQVAGGDPTLAQAHALQQQALAGGIADPTVGGMAPMAQAPVLFDQFADWLRAKAQGAGPGGGFARPAPAATAPATAAASGSPSGQAPIFATPPTPQHEDVALPGLAGGSYRTPVREVPATAPYHIESISAADQAAENAQMRLGTANAQAVKEEGAGDARSAQAIGAERSRVVAQAKDREAYTRSLEEQMQTLSDDVAKQKVDPDRWWKSQGTGDRIKYGVASLFGSLGSALQIAGGDRHAVNKVTEQINANIARDLDEQKREIEAKHGQIGDMQGILASAYRRFGNMDKAMDAAHILSLQQIDAEQKAYAAGTKSKQVLAASDLTSADLARHAAERNASFYKYAPASTGSSAATPAQINALAAKLVEDGKASSVEGAKGMAVRLLAGTTADVRAQPVMKAGKGGDAVGDTAVANIDALRDASGKLPVAGLWTSQNVPGGGSVPGGGFTSQQRQLKGAVMELAMARAKAMGERVTPQSIDQSVAAIIGNGSNDDVEAGIARTQALLRSAAGGGGGAPSGQQFGTPVDDEP
jgi:hypothetical protein